MKLVFTCLMVAILLISAELFAQTRQQGLPIVRSDKQQISYRLNKEMHKDGWTITPEARPDVLEVPCKTPVTTVAFYTDLDSVMYQITPGKSQQFYVFWDGKYALVEVKGVAYVKPAVFTNKYVQSQRGKYTVLVPEVQELVHIAIALTPTGTANKNMVEHDTPYYREVMAHFKAYANDSVITRLDEELKKGLYARLKMDACSFEFKGNKIIKSPVYDRMSWGNENTLTAFIPDLEKLAQKSEFRKFFTAHQPYYAALIKDLENYIPIRQQWEWCEKHFDSKYDSYKVTFSPLVNGSHSVNWFQDNNFTETVLFIRSVVKYPEFNQQVAQGLNTRKVFTEIDHNYVNPVSATYLPQINSVFNNRARWANAGDTKNYSSPEAVFNEYMTWAVFTLYILEHYQPADFKIIKEQTEQFITQKRGFYRFPEFNQKLLDLYQKSTDKKIAALYPSMLAWSKEVQ